MFIADVAEPLRAARAAGLGAAVEVCSSSDDEADIGSDRDDPQEKVGSKEDEPVAWEQEMRGALSEAADEEPSVPSPRGAPSSPLSPWSPASSLSPSSSPSSSLLSSPEASPPHRGLLWPTLDAPHSSSSSSSSSSSQAPSGLADGLTRPSEAAPALLSLSPIDVPLAGADDGDVESLSMFLLDDDAGGQEEEELLASVPGQAPPAPDAILLLPPPPAPLSAAAPSVAASGRRRHRSKQPRGATRNSKRMRDQGRAKRQRI